MIRAIAPLAALAVTASVAAPLDARPPRYDPSHPVALRDAPQVLALGHEYLEDVALPGEDFGSPPAFEALDKPAYWFLRHPGVQPAVRFGCARTIRPQEARMTEALESSDDSVALLALAVLMHARAPSTVRRQHETLVRLTDAHPRWAKALEPFHARFDGDALMRAVAQPAPEERYERDRELSWAIRGIAAVGETRALGRLAELCADDNLRTSLAAERSIEEFETEAGDQALARCVVGWQYDAADRAARTLAKRNPALVRTTLVAMSIPVDERSRYARLLSAVADASVVPRLLELLPQVGAGYRPVIDAVETHATTRHWRALVDLAAATESGVPFRARLLDLAERVRPVGPA
ncbi:MAG: hypothetical protein AAF721_20650 [Myxococcota bacterium]